MAEGGLQLLEEVMDGLWFRQNVLVPGSLHLAQETTAKEAGGLPSPGSEDKSEEKSDRHQVGRRMRPTRLNLVTSDKLFQMSPSLLTTGSRHRPSSLPPSAESSPKSRSSSSRRPPTRAMRSYKSSSELEQDELKGFMDLGFVFHGESLSPRMMSVIPGLQRLGKNAATAGGGGTEQPEGGEEGVSVREKVKRPYLAEAWFIKRPDSPLLNLRMLPASSMGGADMKRHLRFWARSVASTIRQES